MNDLKVSVSPHARSGETIKSIMWTVVVALLPVLVAGVYFFGFYSLAITLTCVLSCLITEYLIVKKYGTKGKPNDGSAVITGLLLAFSVPPTLPLWMAAIGGVFAMGVVKHAFGGLGFNIFNPALMARAFLMTSWPVAMTTWKTPVGDAVTSATYDVVSTATPLAVAKMQGMSELISQEGSNIQLYTKLLLGNVGGCIGETSAILLLLGGLFLMYKKIITWHIPVTYIGSVILFSGLMGQDIIFHVLAGGLMIGAFFMATDYVTSPLTNKGKIIFGIGCGLITMVIRVYGGLPEGVSYSIIIMNGFTPLIDRYTKTKPKGWSK